MDAPTLRFLEELRERARRYGHDGDWIEIRQFVQALYREADVAMPDLEPYLVCPVCDAVMPDCVCKESA